MNQRMTNPGKCFGYPVESQVNMDIHRFISVAKGPRSLRADSEDGSYWADAQVTARGKQVILLILSCDGSYMQSCR